MLASLWTPTFGESTFPMARPSSSLTLAWPGRASLFNRGDAWRRDTPVVGVRHTMVGQPNSGSIISCSGASSSPEIGIRCQTDDGPRQSRSSEGRAPRVRPDELRSLPTVVQRDDRQVERPRLQRRDAETTLIGPGQEYVGIGVVASDLFVGHLSRCSEPSHVAPGDGFVEGTSVLARHR